MPSSKNKNPKIKIVFFDFGGVCVKSTSDRTFKLASKLLGVDEKIVRSKFESHHIAHQIGKERLIDCWRRICIELGSEPKKCLRISKKLIDVYEKLAKPIPQVFGIIKKLKKNGIGVGLISDTCREHAYINFKRGLYRYFDPLILSHKVGVKKPSDDIFLLALRKSRLRPKECVFIDDRIENVKKAKRLGMVSIHFKNPKLLRKELEKLDLI
jgi:epoxide hydrolase-like predicted phosphatase